MQFLNSKTVKIEADYNETTGAFDIKASSEAVPTPVTVLTFRADGYATRFGVPDALGFNKDAGGYIATSNG